MSRSSPAQFAFSSGEISELLYGRPDYQRFQTGLRSCNGFLPLRQGGVTRASGTIFRGYTDANNAGRLIAFEFAVNDALLLEFTPLKMRVWRYGALVDDSANPGTPYELATPYDAAAIARLQWEQSADVIYLVDGVLPMQRLARLALDNWTIGDHQVDDGPFLVQNTDTASTIQASGETGSVTLTASQAIFSANMVGALVQLKPVSYPAIPQWSANETLVVNNVRRYDGNTYKLTAGSNSKTEPPTHIEGTEETSSGVKWQFLTDGVGVARISAFTDANNVTADVLARIPKPVVDAPTYRWAEGAWSAKNGYPAAIAIYDQRLWAAATPAEPRTLWASTIGDYAGFAPGVLADESFAYTISGAASLNTIQWLSAGRQGLYVGALGEIFSMRSDSDKQAIGPTTFWLKPNNTIGVLPDRPIAPDGKPIFIAKDGARIFEMKFSFEENASDPKELSLPSDHLGNPGFAEIVWQSAAQRVAWVRRGDGTLAAMLHDPREDVLGWAPYSLAGGFVESIAASPDPVTGQDTITMIVKRTINGATVRMVEEMPLPYGVLIGSQPISEAVHFFASSVFAPNPATDTFSVPHLVGETVYAWTDQGEFGPYTVPTGGAVVLSSPVNRATIGVFDATHLVETLDIRAAARDGDTTGRDKRVLGGGGVRVHRTAAANYAVVERDLDEGEYIGDVDSILQLPVAAALTQSFSGIAELQTAGGWTKETSYRFLPVGGAPMTILMETPMINEAGD